MIETFLWFSFLGLFHPPLPYAPDLSPTIQQTIAAHGGAMLSPIQSSTSTVLFTDYRMNPSPPLPATLRSFGTTTQMDYTDAQGPITLIRQDDQLWEVRGAQTQTYPGQPMVFQDVFFNPSLGIVRTLSAAEYAYYATSTLRGRPVYVLLKGYWTVPFGSSNYRGTQEWIYLYIDATTYLVAQVDYTYGSDYNRGSLRFENYAVISGIAVPMTVSYTLNNRLVWQAQIQAVRFQ